MQNALKQIEQITDALKAISVFAQDSRCGLAGLLIKLDKLTADHTRFKTFSAMVHAGGNYRPSIPKALSNWNNSKETFRLPCGRNMSIQQCFAELDLLALCYDMAQEARGDSRRAFRS